MCVCVSALTVLCMCTTFVPAASGGQKGASDSLDPELQMAVGQYVGVGN